MVLILRNLIKIFKLVVIVDKLICLILSYLFYFKQNDFQVYLLPLFKISTNSF